MAHRVILHLERRPSLPSSSGMTGKAPLSPEHENRPRSRDATDDRPPQPINDIDAERKAVERDAATNERAR